MPQALEAASSHPASDPPASNAVAVVPRRDRFSAATFRFDLTDYTDAQSNHLENFGAESTHAEQAVVPNRLLQ
jgi:hypothetical protein